MREKPTWLSKARIGRHALPVLLILGFYAAWTVMSTRTAVTYRSYDPQFDYLIDSLAPFKGMPYVYIDHPGTPLLLLGTLFYASTLPFVGSPGADFIEFHLRNPQVFLSIAYGFLLLANAFCSLYFYFTAAEYGRIGVAAGLALALLFFAYNFGDLGTISYWSHAGFNFPFGTLLLLFLVRAVHGSQGELGRRWLIGLGVGAGLLASVVMYLSAWALGGAVTILALYRLRGTDWRTTVRAVAVFAASAFLGFTLAIVPIISQWPRFVDWVVKLVTHQGRFGNGAAGFISPASFTATALDFIDRLPQMFVLLGLTVLAVLLLAFMFRGSRKSYGDAPDWALVIGLLVQILVLLVIIIRSTFHFYLLAVKATAPVLMLATFILLRPYPRIRLALGWALLAFVCINGFTVFRQNYYFRLASQRAQAYEHSHIGAAIDRVAAETGRRPDQLRILWGYGVFEACNALLDGNSYSGFRLDADVSRVCPNQFLIPNGSQHAWFDGAHVPIQELMDGSTVIVVRKAFGEYLLESAPDRKLIEIQETLGSGGPILVIY